MRAIFQTQSERIQQLDRRGVDDLKALHRKLAKQEATSTQIKVATDNFLKRRGIGNHKIQ